MTDADCRIEFDHEYSLRISLMCGSGEPSVDQKAIAFDIAEKHIDQLKKQHDGP